MSDYTKISTITSFQTHPSQSFLPLPLALRKSAQLWKDNG